MTYKNGKLVKRNFPTASLADGCLARVRMQ